MPEAANTPTSPARITPRASNALHTRAPEDTARHLPLSDPAAHQLLVTTFPNFESAHDAIILLNSAGIPPRLEVSAEIYGPISETPPHARRVAITVPAGRLHDARMAIVGLRAAVK